MSTAALPTEPQPIRLDPELADRIGKMLKPLKGEQLEAGQAAVMKVYRSGFAGSFGELVERYKAAIAEAVKAA